MGQWVAGGPPWVEALSLGAGAALVWSLALYVASRSARRRAPTTAALAMLCLTAYLVGAALGALDPEGWQPWSGRTWWAPILAAAFWLLVTLALVAEEGPDHLAAPARMLFVPTAVLSLTIGVALGVLGVAELPTGALLQANQVFASLCVLVAGALVTALWTTSPRGSPLRARFVGLVGSATLFLLGAGWIVFASGVYNLPGLWGQLLLVAAMVILGWNMARYGALLASEQVQADFLAFAGTMLGIVVLYGGLILVLAPPDVGWIARALPLLLLVMATHVVVDTRGHLLDRVLYAPLVGTLRGQLRELSNRVVRQPDELSALVDVRETVDQILRERSAQADLTPAEPARPTELRVLVEGALRHLNDLPTLSQHPLLDELPGLAEASGTPLERAAMLRNALDQAIERLRPSGARPTPGASAVGGWLHYLVLKEAYVDGRPNKQVMQRYALSEGTFHRARRRAIDALASDLWERQRAAANSPSASSVPTRSTV